MLSASVRALGTCLTTLGPVGAFEGVAEIYEESRLGYPIELQTHLVDTGALTRHSLVVDLGAGTGQLVRLVAAVAARVVAIEPEADMLGVGQQVTGGLSNVRWVQGRDSDLRRHFAAGEIDLVMIGNAFHQMDQRRLLQDLDLLVSPDGAVCIAVSSVPVWLQDSDWSLALRSALEDELGPLDGSGVPDTDANAAVLIDSAFSDVSVWSFEQPGTRTCECVLGEIVSSASGRLSRPVLDRLRDAIEPFADHGEFPEVVRTTGAIASRPNRS